MTKENIDNDPYKSAGVDISAGNNLIELIPDKNFTALKKYLNEEVHQNLLVRLDKI